MSPPKDQHRPQTLKQAKKAYQKAGALPRPSELELRRFQRAAELQERADRLKKREQIKKVNLRKKEERLEKEKEARRKAGFPGFEAHLASSQLKLAFKGASGQDLRQHSVQPRNNTLTSWSPPGGSISRRPLQPLSPNILTKSKAPFIATPTKPYKSSIENWDDFVVSNTQVERELSIQKPKAPPLVYTAKPGPAIVQIDDPSDLLGMISTQDLICSVKGSPTIPALAVEECGFKLNPIHEVPEMAAQDLEDSRQDFVPLPAAVATSQNEYPSSPSAASTEDFGSDGIYADEQLKALTQDFQPTSTVKLKPVSGNASDDAKTGEACEVLTVGGAADSFYDEDAPSSQELLALTVRNDFDEFEISTQDLQGLLP